MPTETFRERNRRRRQQNAFDHLREYASKKGLSDPEAAARKAVEGLQTAGERSGRTAPGAVAPQTTMGSGAPRGGAASPAPVAKPGPSGEGPPDAPKETVDEDSSVPHRLEDRTKEQLYARAQELEIDGRSSMTKDQLIAAIRAKQ